MKSNIFQIYHDKSLVPNLIKERALSLNSNYNYNLLDFEDGKKIILENFKSLDAVLICDTIDKLPRYCHKSDLLRYCLLYLYGGFYLDVDLELLLPIDEFAMKADFITSFGRGAEKFQYKSKNGSLCQAEKIMANGILYSKKKSSILLDLIKFCIQSPASSKPSNRGLYIEFLYQYLNSKSGEEISPFRKFKIKDESVYLFNTKDDQKYGINCIFDEGMGVIINPNNFNYSIPRQTSGSINLS